LIDTAKGRQGAQVLRRMLLNFLTANPGSTEVEDAYLRPYRQRLKSDVSESLAQHEVLSARDRQSHAQRK
jgi:hypothetical protein